MCSQNFLLKQKGFDQKTFFYRVVFQSLPFYILTQFGEQIAIYMSSVKSFLKDTTFMHLK